MREFERKRKVRKIASSPLVLIPLAIILFFLVRGVWNIYTKNRDSVAELRSSQERLARLNDRAQSLAAASAKLSTESGIEEEIRDRLQMTKEGEREIVIVATSAQPSQESTSQKGFLQKVWDFFTIR